MGQLRRVIKKHGGQTEAKTSIFKGLLLNNGSTLGAVNSLMDFFFDAKETDTSGKDPYDQSTQFISAGLAAKRDLVSRRLL